MAALTENQVITAAYYISEKGNDPWSSTSDEYVLARNLANAAIDRWEFYDQTRWKDLFSTLTAAADGTKTITAGTYTYSCPTNFRYPSSYVRIVDSGGSSSFWQVVPPEKLAFYANSSQRVVWFTGSIKSGFTLNINSYNITLVTGYTINYEYYKQATKFTATTDTTEMSDPYFISYYIAAHVAEDGIDPDLNNMAEPQRNAYFDTLTAAGTLTKPLIKELQKHGGSQQKMIQRQADTVQIEQLKQLVSATGLTQEYTTPAGDYFAYTDDQSGEIKVIDKSFEPSVPELTGSPELDKELLSGFNSEITKKRNLIVDLFELGQLSVEEAEQQLAELVKLKQKFAKPKRPPFIKIAAPARIRIAQPQPPKMIRIKPYRRIKKLQNRRFTIKP